MRSSEHQKRSPGRARAEGEGKVRAGSRTMPWTSKEDERLRSMIIAGQRAPEIAIQLQRSVAAVNARAHKLRLSLKRLKAKK
jgi:hypothetical protein